MGIIVLLGLVLIFMGRSRRIAAADTLPRVNKDHWHAAYGIYICDKFIPNLSDAKPDTRGIHTHADGIIHIHPFTSIAAGKNADLGQFFWETNVSVSDSKITLPSNETWTNGKACPGANGQPGAPGKLVLAEWVDANAKDAAPKIITSGISSTRFTHDRMAFTLAFVPDDKVASLPKPDSVPTLDSLSDVAGSSSSSATSAPPAAVSSSTTAPGAPADQSTTTVPGAPANPASTTAVPGAPASTASSAPASTTTTAKSGG
jgi:hypothetical protein